MWSLSDWKGEFMKNCLLFNTIFSFLAYVWEALKKVIPVLMAVCVFTMMVSLCVTSISNQTIFENTTTFLSSITAFGMLWFATLSYFQQKDTLFQNEFTALLQEHSRILMTTFYKDNQLTWDTKSALQIAFVNNFLNFSNPEVYEDNSFDPNEHGLSNQYFVLLFRILEKIDQEYGKRRDGKAIYYSNTIQALIPNPIMYLIAANALNKGTFYTNYRNLLIKFHFFELLPLTEQWLEKEFDAKRTLPPGHFNHKSAKQFIEKFMSQFTTEKDSAFANNLFIQKE